MCVTVCVCVCTGASIVEVDFNYKHSLVVAMLGVKCVFLHTVYWENYSCMLEVMHVTTLFSTCLCPFIRFLLFFVSFVLLCFVLVSAL